MYANCIHRPNAQYRSVGSLLMANGSADVGQGLGDDVHILYGLSKDLGVAGWRVSKRRTSTLSCACVVFAVAVVAVVAV